MANFFEFYQGGGVFMHLITLLSAMTGVLLMRRVGAIRRTLRDPTAQATRLQRREVLTPTVLCTMLLCGALGTSLGFISVCAALRTVAPEQIHLAAMMGGRLASYPVVWALLLAVPLTIGHGVLRHFEERLRVLVLQHT